MFGSRPNTSSIGQSVAAMGLNGGEDGRSLVSLETGENQESVPPNLTTLCELCKDLNDGFRNVGFGPSYNHVFSFETRWLGQIRKESKTCLLCGEIAEFYNKWSRDKFRDEVPNLGGRATRVFFQLHRETGFPINRSYAPELDHTMANVNRIRVQFEVSNRRSDSGSICPVLQFQKCSQPPLQVSNGGSLCDWESAEEQPYSGRIRPLLADTQLFCKWKDTCGDAHGDHCNTVFTGSRPRRLRLIDVKKRCVVDNEDGSSYVALSYVWGEWELKKHFKQMPKLTKLTEYDFQKPGSLTRKKVLSTIDDAIDVTQSLGENYLWVDCLCILQKDDEDNHRQEVEADQQEFIPQMDSIYGFASVTIVAASGGNADAGLPGIKPESRTRKQKPFTIIRKFYHVSLVRTLDPEGSRDGTKDPYYYLDDSVWCKRGWTLQEKIFSSRALIFSKEQVYWECQKATWCEDGFWETKKSRTIYRPCFRNDFRHPWPEVMSRFESIYQNLVVEYSGRTLTYGSDGLDAFEGILNALRREARQDFLWALPISLLGRMLTWFCDEQSFKRREEMCPVKSSEYRTTDPCPFPSWSWVGWVGVFNSFIMPSSSDLIFYYLNGKRQLRRVDEADDGQINIVWPKGCIVQALSRGTGRADVFLEEIPESVCSQSIASNILFFWSSTTKLHVRPGDKRRDGHDNLILSHGDKDLECVWFQTPVLVPDQETVDFVTIGGDYQNTLAVLLINWKDGVAYRRGLVTILGSCWEELDNREWKMISLG